MAPKQSRTYSSVGERLGAAGRTFCARSALDVGLAGGALVEPQAFLIRRLERGSRALQDVLPRGSPLCRQPGGRVSRELPFQRVLVARPPALSPRAPGDSRARRSRRVSPAPRQAASACPTPRFADRLSSRSPPRARWLGGPVRRVPLINLRGLINDGLGSELLDTSKSRSGAARSSRGTGSRASCCSRATSPGSAPRRRLSSRCSRMASSSNPIAPANHTALANGRPATTLL